MGDFTIYLTAGFSESYYEGAAQTAVVPWKWDYALNGIPFVIDEQYINDFRHNSTPLLRPQQDSASEPGSGSVNPASLWGRSKTSWHLGAGQRQGDRVLGSFQSLFQQGNPARFYQSKGVDVWTDGQISLLPATDQKKVSSNTNLKLCVAGSRMYLIDGASCQYTTDATGDTPTFSDTTGEPGGTLLDIASDGFNVWITDGATLSKSTTGGSVFSSYSTEDIDVLGYVKGRLMCAEDNEIFYDVSGTITSLFVHANTNFQWVGFAEGQAAIYAAGYSGDKSLIYRIGLRPDATGLDQPIVAGELPDGEIVRSIGAYLGFVLLGTDLGWRFCIPDGQGNLRIGTLVSTGAAVRCFEGQERFVWGGLTNYDGTSTGLFRMDVSAWGNEERQQPAYATDLMVTAQGAVLSVVTFGSRRYLTVSGSGVWGQDTLLVASGILDEGFLDFDLADEKIALELAVTYATSFAGSHNVALAVDGSSTFSSVGDTLAAGTASSLFPINEVRANKFEIRHTLTRDASATTTGPTVTGRTLRVQAAPNVKPRITVPLKLFSREVVDGVDAYMKPGDTLASLKALNVSREVVVAQEGSGAYSVILDDYEWRPEHRAADRDQGWEGCFVAALKVLS